jgi:hypothetical protein
VGRVLIVVGVRFIAPCALSLEGRDATKSGNTLRGKLRVKLTQSRLYMKHVRYEHFDWLKTGCAEAAHTENVLYERVTMRSNWSATNKGYVLPDGVLRASKTIFMVVKLK